MCGRRDPAEQVRDPRPGADERSRRLWAATEALALGHGGIALVARATGMAVATTLGDRGDGTGVESGGDNGYRISPYGGRNASDPDTRISHSRRHRAIPALSPASAPTHRPGACHARRRHPAVTMPNRIAQAAGRAARVVLKGNSRVVIDLVSSLPWTATTGATSHCKRVERPTRHCPHPDRVTNQIHVSRNTRPSETWISHQPLRSNA